jgi:t-SNARE complex subunit (syntaxin)
MKNIYNFSNVTINTKENINGDVHITNYLDNTSKKEFSRQEQELVDLIYQHTSSDSERDELLKMLNTYRSSSQSEKEITQSTISKRFKEFAEKVSLPIVTDLITEILKHVILNPENNQNIQGNTL